MPLFTRPQLKLDTPLLARGRGRGRRGWGSDDSAGEDDDDSDDDDPIERRLRRLLLGGSRSGTPRPFHVKLRFGRTEVTATARECSSGRSASVAVKFAHS